MQHIFLELGPQPKAVQVIRQLELGTSQASTAAIPRYQAASIGSKIILMNLNPLVDSIKAD